MLLAIDPGLDTGWALFSSQTCLLIACGLGDPRAYAGHRMDDIQDVIIEHPFVYAGAKTKNPKSIVKLAINAGEWGGTYKQHADVHYVLPFVWKKQIPKDVHHERLKAVLSDDELDVYERAVKGRLTKPLAKSKQHNVLDAIGLGLWQNRRFRP